MSLLIFCNICLATPIKLSSNGIHLRKSAIGYDNSLCNTFIIINFYKLRSFNTN